jgi:uncharacterized protein (DUF305 family)
MGGDHGDMPGMMSSTEMSDLESASDAEFETRWLQLMVEHHTGAVEMAEAERSGGRYGPAKELAGQIIASQSAEIEEMRGLLGS